MINENKRKHMKQRNYLVTLKRILKTRQKLQDSENYYRNPPRIVIFRKRLLVEKTERRGWAWKKTGYTCMKTAITDVPRTLKRGSSQPWRRLEMHHEEFEITTQVVHQCLLLPLRSKQKWSPCTYVACRPSRKALHNLRAQLSSGIVSVTLLFVK